MKIIQILILILMFSNFGCNRIDNSQLEKEAINLILEKKSLSDKIFKKLTFTLIDKQPMLSGQNAKFILKSEDERLWFFKIGKSNTNLDQTYKLLSLCGQKVPLCYEITLPVNGKKERGIIQEFIPSLNSLATISINNLSKKQINYIQKQQIIDWLIADEEIFECDPSQFLLTKDKIISINKYNIFSSKYINETLINDFNTKNKENYYSSFWEAYINKNIPVDFAESFELINYIRNIDNGCFKTLSICAEYKDLLIERKDNLMYNFEQYYRYLSSLRNCRLKWPSKPRKAKDNYLLKICKKLKNDIKKEKRKLLNWKTLNSQKDIQVIISPTVRNTIKEFGFPDCYYLNNIAKFKQIINSFKRKFINLNEKLALYLFLYQIKPIENGITPENFFEMEPLYVYSPKTLDIQMIESILRITDYDIKGFYIDTIEDYLTKEKRNETIIHILYILTTCFSFDAPDEVLNRYKTFNQNKEIKEILDVLEIDNIDKNYVPRIIQRLNNLNNNYDWKHFLLAFFYNKLAVEYPNMDFKNKAIAELKKTLGLTKDKIFLYISNLFLGYLYEHNKDYLRFGEGFNVSAAIGSYNDATKLNHNCIIAHLNLATLYLIKGMPEQALSQFNNIAKINYKYASEHFHFKNTELKEFKKLDRIKKNNYLRMHSLSENQRNILNLAIYIKKNNENN
ncbi:MAG: hypothetical protein ABIH18_06895 [Candidatus Omnitrophota bacterium]